MFGKVCGHLGIEQPAASALLDQRIKNKNAAMLSPIARRVLAPLKGAVAPWRENAAFRFARALIARRIDYPALTPALRDQLADYYREDVAALGRLLGRDLGGWLVEREPDASGRSAA